MEEAPEPIHSIYKIIHEAQAFQGKDYQKGIDLLEKAKKILPQLNDGKGESHQTVANNTIDNASLELTYRSKLANLYYNIREYEQSYNLYKAIIEKVPSNPRLHKAAGDSLRHLERYEEAIRLYEEGIKICSVIKSFAEFQGAIQNSLGLTYIALQQYDQAASKFDAAINISPKNPLYYCNLASAYLNKGDRTKAQATYEAAAKLLKEPLDSEGLTKDNIKFIDKTLGKFLDNLKKLQQVKSDDPDLNKRINRFGQSLTKTMETGLDNAKEIPNQKTPQLEAKLIVDSGKILEMVKSPGNEKLNQFYNGMKTTLEDNYLSAKLVKDGKVTVNSGNLATTIASNLAGFIPIIGSQLSSAINFTGNFITQAQLKKQAINITKISDGVVEFNDLARDTVLRLIDNNKDYLMGVDPDRNILPAWAESFEAAAKWLKEKKEQFQDRLFGSEFETSMQRYGYKLSMDLVSKYIATGTIYGKDKAVDIRADEMLKRLSHACEDVFKADKHSDKEGASKNKAVANQPQEGGKKCEIY